ncbi:MAG: tetratricopeptide repeat protein [Polyangiaceae bacterium]
MAVPLVGREAELATLSRTLAERRTAVLVGPPGVGKTRLAIEHCQRASRDFRLVALRECTSVAEVYDAIARYFGAAPRFDEDLVELAQLIAGSGVGALILDDADAFGAPLAEAIEQWLSADDELQVLLTARRRLSSSFEAIAVQPLTRPSSVADARESPAYELFLRHASEIRLGYSPTDADQVALVELVNALDGLPLALELAAARMGVLGPRQILERVTRRFELLDSSLASGLERTLAWAWQLLDVAEAKALAQCSVFRGGFDLDAAEAVLELPTGARPVMDVLELLRQQSLLLTSVHPETGDLRFGMLHTVSDYAAERLDDVDQVRRRHAEHYLVRAARGSDVLPERENLLAVHRFGLESEEPEVRSFALDAALALEPAFASLGSMRLFASLLREALPTARSVRKRALGRMALAQAELQLGSLAQAERSATLAEADAQEIGDARLRGRACCELGRVRRAQARFDESERLFEAAATDAQREEDHGFLARALLNLVACRMEQGRYEEVEATLREALALFEAAGDERGLALCWAHRGELAENRGHLEAARRDLSAARDAARQQGLTIFECIADVRLAAIAHEQGEGREAQALIARAMDLHAQYGASAWHCIVFGQRARLHHAAGKYQEAAEDYELAVSLAKRSGLEALEAVLRAALAALLAECGQLGASERQGAGTVEFLERAGARLDARAAKAYALCLDVARVRRSAEAGDNAAAAARLSRVHAARDDLAVGPTSTEIRFALACLDRVIDAANLGAPGEGRSLEQAAHRAHPDALLIGPDAFWFRAPGAERADLQRRTPLRLVLGALVQAREQSPGRALAVAELLARGWPGERVLRRAGASRVYNALSTLRDLGLRSALKRDGEGYLLDPELPLCRVPEPEGSGSSDLSSV